MSQCGTSVVTVAVVVPAFDILTILAIGTDKFSLFLVLYFTLYSLFESGITTSFLYNNAGNDAALLTGRVSK